MASPITITSPTHLTNLLSQNEYTLLDFWATWCPPCKAIAPLFTTLATQHSAPGTLAFAKIDVDAQRAIAAQYRISAMPTFLLLRGNVPVKAVRGADAAAVRRVVGYAVRKGRGESVSEEEEGRDGVGVLEGGGGIPWPTVLLLAFLAYYFFFKK